MKRPVVVIAVLFFLFPLIIITYRIAVLGYPVFPTSPGNSWTVSMNARLARSPAGQVALWAGIPVNQPGISVLEEYFLSGTLDLGLTRAGSNRFAVYSGPLGEEPEWIGYTMTVAERSAAPTRESPLRLPPFPLGFEKADQDLLERLTKRWVDVPVGTRVPVVAGAIRGEWGSPPPSGADLRAWTDLLEKHGQTKTLLALFRAARLHARGFEGLRLVESVRNQPLSLIEVWAGSRWERLRPETGEPLRISGVILPLAVGGSGALQINEGKVSDVRWVISRRTLSDWRLHFERILRSDKLLDRWSFFHLPQQFQETFRILLLVPIGALLMAILRNVVGLSTFGVFMPVLMALAFRSMGLLYGLIVFTGVVGIGYFLRMALDRMRLLLVPRLSVMLTLVISCLTILALIGNKIGLREFMAVGLLPFVILTMVIERFFVLVEESGVREGIRTALGSAAVAVICYGILHFEELQLTFFIYPELLFAVAALQLLLGRYTGYRLSELLRFKSFRSAA